MALLPDTGSVLAVVSGALLLLLAAFVLTVKPRRRANVLLAVFSGCLGAALPLWHAEGSILFPGAPLGPLRLAGLAFGLPAGLAGLGLALLLPRRLARADAHALALALAVAAALAGLRTLSHAAAPGGPLVWSGASHVVTAVVPGLLAGLLLLAQRYPRLPSAAERRQALMLSAALAPWPALTAGFNLALLARASAGVVPAPSLGLPVATSVYAGALLLLAALWLRNVGLVEGPGARASRRFAHALLLAMLAGLASSVVLGTAGLVTQAGITALTWLLTAALLAWAVLRHQLLGLDVKVKWTVKQSTVAAAFVGVFFVASEGAASFFADTAGSQYLGIAAAGLLVFALAPLQRAAERVADAALPGVKPPEAMAPRERAAVYREAAAHAWADGNLDRSERALLDRLQASLRIGSDEAMRIEQEAAAGR